MTPVTRALAVVIALIPASGVAQRPPSHRAAKPPVAHPFVAPSTPRRSTGGTASIGGPPLATRARSKPRGGTAVITGAPKGRAR